MNILIVTSHLNKGGIPKYVLSLAKGLSRKNRVIVASWGGEWMPKLAKYGCEFVRIPLNTKSVLSPKICESFSLLKPFLQDVNVDVVHANTRVSQFLAFLIWKFLKVPYVATFHGYYRPHIFRKIFCWF